MLLNVTPTRNNHIYQGKETNVKRRLHVNYTAFIQLEDCSSKYPKMFKFNNSCVFSVIIKNRLKLRAVLSVGFIQFSLNHETK